MYVFKLKAGELYAEWLKQNETPVDEQLKFGNKWAMGSRKWREPASTKQTKMCGL